MRALVVTNMYPTPERPALRPVRARPGRGAAAARRRRGRAVRVPAPGTRDYPRAARELRRRYRRPSASTSCTRTSGSTAWPALLARLAAARRDAARQRPAAPALATRDPRARCRSWRSPRRSRARSARTSPARARRGASRCCPCGDRPRALPADPARARRAQRLGLDPDGPYLLFPHDPSRPLKRFDRAREAAGDVRLLTLGGVPRGRGAVLDQRGQRGASCRRRTRASGSSVIEALGLRRARVRHAGRDRTRSRWRGSTASACAAVGPRRLAGGAGAAPRGARIRASTGAPRAELLLGRPDGRARRRRVARAAATKPRERPPILAPTGRPARSGHS